MSRKTKVVAKPEKASKSKVVKKPEPPRKVVKKRESVKKVAITIEVKTPKTPTPKPKLTPKPVPKIDKIDVLFEKAKRELLDGPMISSLPPEIEVVVSFDTTGSMYPCLSQVRREVSSFFKELFVSIPKIKFGVIAHGDYCDAGSTYVTKKHELSSNAPALIDFVNRCGNTCGGDAAECYELVLHEARSFNWTAGKNKVLILIGDDVPHSPHEPQNTKHLDWRNELKCLLEMGVKVYSVQALNRHHATPFYKEMARITGGFHLELNQFSEISDLIHAVCYQQAGTEQLQGFEKRLASKNRLSRSMRTNLGRLYGKSDAETLAEITREYGATDLQVVSPGRFQVLDVDEDCQIDQFVKSEGLTFQKGKGFYEFTKAVDIQSYKEVVLMDRRTGDMFTGNKAREIMGIPIGVNARCRPETYSDKYVAFIQSTSMNRKLLAGTKFLYEVDASR